jgi:hypothetical protein
MASTFTDLGIEKMATGENAGTWGDKTNTNLEIVEKAIAGYVEQAVTSGGTTALSITDGDATESTSVARHAVIKLTGTITGNSIVTVPDSIEKVYIVTNGTSGAYTVQFKTASGTGVTFGVSEKTTKLFYSDGTNIVDAGFSGGTDLDGKELILDADADTSITADTDDQIDIKIAGADDFQFTANTFTAQSGSGVVIPDGGLTLGSTAVTSTAAELNLVDGGTSATSTTVADADRVVLNDNGTMVQVAVTDLAAYFDDEITAMPNLTSVGTLTTLTVDNVIINGSTIGHTGDTDLMTVASGVLTVAGEVDATSLDISGDADIDGTLEADAITVDGTTLAEFISDTTGAMFSSNTETGITATYQDSDNTIDLALAAAQTTITSLLATDIKIGEDDQTKIDFETADEIHFYAANAEQVYVADGIFGPQTDSDVDLGSTGVRWKDAFVDTLTTTGAITVGGDLTVNGTTTTVNSTTVTIDDPIFTLGGDSAPGSDDNKDRGIEFRYHDGSSARIGFFGFDDSAGGFTFLTAASNSSEVFSGTVGNLVVGTVAATSIDADGGVTVDNITIDGTEIDLSSGDLTVDVAGDIKLDAGGGCIDFDENGTNVFKIASDSSDIRLKTMVSDKDFKIQGNDGGVNVNALTFDMSAAGAATFNAGITAQAASTITTDDNSDTLTLVSTDADASLGPVLNLYRNSSSPADNDVLGRFKFVGRNDNSQDWQAMAMTVSAADVSDGTEDATMDWYIMNNGSETLRLSYQSTETVFNDASIDLDFRVESNGNTHAIFVEGSSSHIGINTSSPQSDLHITGSDTSTSVIIENTNADASAAPDLFLFRNSSSPADDDSLGNIEFRGKNDNTEDTRYVINNAKAIDVSDGTEDGQIEWQILNAGSFQKILTMNPTEVVINEDSGSTDFRVESNGQANAFKIDGGADTASFAVPVDIDAGVTIDNITIDGTEIDLSSGDLTIDVAGDIKLNAGGNDVMFESGSTTYLKIINDSGSAQIRNAGSDKDISFLGNDGGSTITALTLDMSAAGAATFNNDVTAFSDKRLKDNIETIPNALDKVCAMRGVNFTRNDNDNQPGTGVIAQEMQEVFPVVVKESNDELNTLSVSYGNLVGVLIEAIKELKNKVEKLEEEK